MSVQGDPDPSQVVSSLTGDLGSVARDLLLYKALFASPLFDALTAQTSDPVEADALAQISKETHAQMLAAIDALHLWNGCPIDVTETAADLRARLLVDILHIKESTTEAFLLAGMRAPTNELRRVFVALAETDRKHAEALRALLGTYAVEAVDLRAGKYLGDGTATGAFQGRAGEASFSRRIHRALEDMRADGQEPTALIMSPVALRHARDEGLLGPNDGTAFGVPVDVDMGWRGECFAIATRERVTLAELILARATEFRRAPAPE